MHGGTFVDKKSEKNSIFTVIFFILLLESEAKMEYVMLPNYPAYMYDTTDR